MTRVTADPIPLGSSLTNQLKQKSRKRRDALAESAAAQSRPPLVRNNPLPPLTLTSAALTELRVNSRKLRKLDPAHVQAVAASIAALGFCAPILVGKNGFIIDGEVRFEAAKLLGLPAVPCIHIDHLSDVELRVLRLAINRLGEKGQWDLKELRVEMQELTCIDAPLEVSGFSSDERDHIVLDDSVLLEEGVLAPEVKYAVSRLGDIFRLGNHTIACGDARDPTVWAALMDDDVEARVLLTDEPYNVPIAGNVTGGDHREFAMASGEMSDDQFLQFNEAWISAALLYLRDGGVFGTWIDWRGLPIVHAAAKKLCLVPLNLVVWNKTNAGMGSLYRSQHELFPLFKKGSAAHLNNVQLGKKGRWRSNVWTYPGASSLGSDARRGLEEHPTVKPTAMLEDALLDLSDRGEVVLDPFLGSGSTLIAAEKTGRICRGIELDPLYVDVIIRRYEAVTGGAAILVETGETFAALAARRAHEQAEAANGVAAAAEPAAESAIVAEEPTTTEIA